MPFNFVQRLTAYDVYEPSIFALKSLRNQTVNTAHGANEAQIYRYCYHRFFVDGHVFGSWFRGLPWFCL